MAVILFFAFIILLAGAIALIRRAYPVAATTDGCPACGYTLVGLPAEGPCPECGQAPEARRRAIAARPTRWSVAAVSLVLVIAAEAGLLALLMVGTRDGGAFLASLLFTPIPHVALWAFVAWFGDRLTPRAASGLTICGLLGTTPPLAYACHEIVIGKPDAFAGLVVAIVSFASMAPMAAGLFVGSLLLQVRWFRYGSGALP